VSLATIGDEDCLGNLGEGYHPKEKETGGGAGKGSCPAAGITSVGAEPPTNRERTQLIYNLKFVCKECIH
jgi:hypothetical protein